MMAVPENPKLYHIVHLDRLPSIIDDGGLWSDAERCRRELDGTSIGIAKIKQRRLEELTLTSHPGLHVGDCVPFYFCPRSVMLYMLHMGNNPDLPYSGGQKNIIHLEADLHRTVEWANANGRRWAFTDGNAGSYFFNDWKELARLDRLNWNAIQADDWRNFKEGKQAEFLFERMFPWKLVERIGVINNVAKEHVEADMVQKVHRPPIQILREWYY